MPLTSRRDENVGAIERQTLACKLSGLHIIGPVKARRSRSQKIDQRLGEFCGIPNWGKSDIPSASLSQARVPEVNCPNRF